MTTMNKPLPHRPFSLAGNLEKGLRRPPQQPQMTTVSPLVLRPYVPANDKFTVPPLPKRAHLGRPLAPSPAPLPPVYHAASDALPSSKASHSFSQSHPHSSTSDLIPPHLKPVRKNSWWRRHWFVIVICILALLGISIAVGVVLAHGNRANRDAGVYVPASVSSGSSSVIIPASEVPLDTLVDTITNTVATVVSNTISNSVTGGNQPLPSSAAPSPS